MCTCPIRATAAATWRMMYHACACKPSCHVMSLHMHTYVTTRMPTHVRCRALNAHAPPHRCTHPLSGYISSEEQQYYPYQHPSIDTDEARSMQKDKDMVRRMTCGNTRLAATRAGRVVLVPRTCWSCAAVCLCRVMSCHAMSCHVARDVTSSSVWCTAHMCTYVLCVS